MARSSVCSSERIEVGFCAADGSLMEVGQRLVLQRQEDDQVLTGWGSDAPLFCQLLRLNLPSRLRRAVSRCRGKRTGGCSLLSLFTEPMKLEQSLLLWLVAVHEEQAACPL